MNTVVEIFLYVCVTGSTAGSPNYLCQQHKMESLKVCESAAQTLRIPSSNDPKANTVFAYCATQGKWK